MSMEYGFEVTEDRILGGRVILAQPAEGYRAAVDPVLLAAFVAARPGQKVLDLGCGAGAAALCLMARVGGLSLVGLEIQPRLVELARANAAANGITAFQVVEGSAARPPADLGRFDHVMTNPPYLAAGRGTRPPLATKAAANMEGEVDLAAWIKAACARVAPKGSLCVIQRADRLADLLAALAGRGMGGVRVFPLWPKPGRPAGRVMVSARKGSKASMELLPGLVLHEADGRYGEAAEAILRHGRALEG